MFDTGREGRFLDVPFGPFWTPIGTPVRKAYSLLPWAMEQGKDEALMSSLLKCAFSGNAPLHQQNGMRKAVEAGREAFLAGRIPRKRFASASSPIDGLIS